MSWLRQLLSGLWRKVSLDDTAERMVKEWIEDFPDRCLICAYHRFGVEHGLTRGQVRPHTCIEQPSGEKQA